ncbi:DUF2062 domain-containing protein [Roseomonas marmotae]|uniref:DUF2062 domain-containing protein n=1 Tax=Roseomonas marmotae TaxID=2768161 RepID=UPI001AD7062A|nr:DUF2062 domain-containing protein [Roseomonas marmotae]QTI80071.1 DUF2062 domain-containing protein [Roseomonas marmotae]
MSPRALLRRARDYWAGLLASPGGPGRVSRGMAAGAAAAMLPAFGLHLVIAAALAWLLRGSLPVATAACLFIGNPLTHLFLLPLEFELGRRLVPPSLDLLPKHGPGWLLLLLPDAEGTLAGGLLLAFILGLAVLLLSRWSLRAKEAKPR